MALHDYTGQRIIINSAAGGNIVNTLIASYDWEYMVASINNPPEALCNGDFISVLILAGDGVHEYQGKVRRTPRSSFAQIALCKGKLLENRTARRFPVSAAARVEHLVAAAGALTPLPSPLDIVAVNISSTGALLRAAPGCLLPEDVFDLELDIGGTPTTLRTKVVWIHVIDTANADYGCELISQETSESKTKEP